VYGPPGVVNAWPRSLELQLQEKDCGNFFPLGTQATIRARRRDAEQLAPIYEATAPPELFELKPREPGDHRPNYVIYGRCDGSADWEKPLGEWNTVDLYVLGAESVHAINGHIVMRLTDTRRPEASGWALLTRGRISLQSEGAEVFYRAIEWCPLIELPNSNPK
jgi:hypothetical protein